ncbi:hypothetical protein PoB_004806900 [Plakobranchus ocellatus]|uniref:Uncharacterized protein n=1 Tax=Plakobranchus ocellatus TaxID=259542 RepID=A0AAV4BRV1_9GAST|nr:hypothetical protein PoB_004806900 [Plakobranchus ocellatus]
MQTELYNVKAPAQGKSGVTRFDGHAAPPECHAAIQGRAGSCGCRTPNTRPQHPFERKKGKKNPVPKPSTYRHRYPYRNTKFLGRKWPAKILNLSGLKSTPRRNKPKVSPDSPRHPLPPNSNSSLWRQNLGRQRPPKKKRKIIRQKKNRSLQDLAAWHSHSPRARASFDTKIELKKNVTFGAR